MYWYLQTRVHIYNVGNAMEEDQIFVFHRSLDLIYFDTVLWFHLLHNSHKIAALFCCSSTLHIPQGYSDSCDCCLIDFEIEFQKQIEQ